MVYETFLETVKNSLKESLGPAFTLEIKSIQKNNGLILDGLSIKKSEEKAAPTIYLNPFYESFINGLPFNRVLKDILNFYNKNQFPETIQLENLFSPEEIKSKIIFRLINEPANRILLDDVPHISYPDLELSLIFCLSIEETKDNLLTLLIHNQHLKTWNLSTEELLKAAKINTPHLFPACIKALPEVIKDISKKTSEHQWEASLDEFIDMTPLSPPMYVLTNHIGIYGAACLFYEGIIKDFASCNDSDLIILPSSIHEVLIIPYSKDISIEELAQTVFCINKEEVPLDDQLSNHIYYYSKKNNSLSITFTSSVPIGTKNP